MFQTTLCTRGCWARRGSLPGDRLGMRDWCIWRRIKDCVFMVTFSFRLSLDEDTEVAESPTMKQQVRRDSLSFLDRSVFGRRSDFSLWLTCIFQVHPGNISTRHMAAQGTGGAIILTRHLHSFVLASIKAVSSQKRWEKFDCLFVCFPTYGLGGEIFPSSC